MVWKGKKVFWTEGEPQVYDVMDHVHEGYNLSDDDMMFLFVDIEKRNDNSNLQRSVTGLSVLNMNMIIMYVVATTRHMFVAILMVDGT